MAYIALGSNMGDRVAEIERACNEMDRRGIKVKRTSSLWETEPMYVTDQDRFVNGACEACISKNICDASC
jgi:2-amino-4-hydroxy-6-hydroxymethyldihydropteridine diphosphokinase/dihydropteroate synthase